MYEAYYNFSARPFQLSPDPGFFFGSAGHQRALAYLRYGLQQGQGFVVVTGDIGTGKTTLLSALFRELDATNVIAVRINSSNLGPEDLLRFLCAQLQLPWESLGKAALLWQLERCFRDAVVTHRRVLLVVDEAQNLPRESLEELRMLSNFEHDGQPAVQGFLLGQREFRDALQAPGLEQFRQRVLASHHLQPLSLAETETYIRHRLGCVGWHGDPVLADGLCQRVFSFTNGVPRRINTLMDRLLLNASLVGSHLLDDHIVREVTSELVAERNAGAPPVTPTLSPQFPSNATAVAAPAHMPDVQRLEARLAALQRAFAVLDPPATAASAATDETESNKREIPIVSEAIPPRRRPWGWLLLLALALFALTGAAFYLNPIK